MLNHTANLVLGEGPQKARIVIVGEAPGSEEVKAGRPFVGAAGRLLDKHLETAGINRSTCYITNVIKEKPYNNDVGPFIKFSKKGVEKSESYNTYHAYLQEEINNIDPNLIIAVGNVSLYALTGEQGITKWRGSKLQATPAFKNRKVIPIIHPAAALRQVLFEYYIGRDLYKCAKSADTPDLDLPVRNLQVSPTCQEVLDFIEMCRSSDLTAFDIEVSRGEMSCISLAPYPEEAMTIPFMSGGSPTFKLIEEDAIMQALAAFLADPTCRKVAHNSYFDCSFLLEHYGFTFASVEDTMIAFALLYPDFPKSLAFCTSLYTDEPYYKDEGDSVIREGESISATFLKYCAKDSAVCREIFPKFEEMLKVLGNWSTYQRQLACVEPLTFLQAIGLPLAQDKVVSLRDSYTCREQQLFSQLSEMALTKVTEGQPAHDDPANWLSPEAAAHTLQTLWTDKKSGELVLPSTFVNSGPQLKLYLVDFLRLPLYKGKPGKKKKETDRGSFDEESLKRYAIQGAKEAELIMEIRSIRKLLNSYIEVRLDEDKRLRGGWNPVGTRTGRFSCSQVWRGPNLKVGLNLQTLPPRFKPCVVADEGYVMFNVDLSQAENRIVAYLSRDQRLIDAFESGVDVHCLAYSTMYGIPASEVSDKKGSSPLGNGMKSQRDWGKVCNHSLNYDLGYRSFSKKVELPQKEGKVMHSLWHRAFPNVKQVFHPYVREQLERTKTITNLYGRRMRMLDRWGDTLFKEAYASIPQSTVSDHLNEHGFLPMYFAQPGEPLGHAMLLDQVHDSLLFQLPLKLGWGLIAECLRELVRRLETPLHFEEMEFVIPADVEMGLNYGEQRKMKELIYEPEKLEPLYESMKEASNGR